MRRRFALVLLVVACTSAPGCFTRGLRGAPVETAAPIYGTLYITHPSQVGSSPTISVVRNGVVSEQSALSGVLIARDKPVVRFPTTALRGGRSCEPVAISTHGVYGACLRADGHGSVVIFPLAHPFARRLTAAQVTVNTSHMIGFIDDQSLAVAADDESCPSFARNDAIYSYEPRARLWVIGMDGSVKRKGPCAHGIVVGTKKIALIFHDGKDQPQYSFDGTNWQPGLAVAFDGYDSLLIINKWDQLVDEGNKVIAEDVVDAYWTR